LVSCIRSVVPVCTPANSWFPCPTRLSIPSCILICTAIFAQLTAQSPYTLQWAAIFPLRIILSHVGIWSPFSTCFIPHTHVHILNDVLIGLAIFAGLTIVTDRQTMLLHP